MTKSENKVGRPRSPAWKLFPYRNTTRLGKQQSKPTCIKCGKVFATENISKLIRHLNVCPKRNELTVYEKVLAKAAPSEVLHVAGSEESANKAARAPHGAYEDRCAPEDVEEFLLLLGTWAVACDIPMDALSSDFFKQMITSCRPKLSAALPTSPGEAIEGRLLQRIQTDLTAEKQAYIEKGHYLTLITDGWTDFFQAGYVSCCLYSGRERSSLFYRNIRPDAEQETPEYYYYFDAVCNVIEEVGPSKFTAVVFENCSTMMRVGELVEENYKNIYSVGCTAHLLNLLDEDIFAIEFFKTTLAECVDIIKYIKNRQVLCAVYKRLKGDLKVPGIGLCLPVEARCAASIRCIQSIDENWRVLEAVLNDAQYLAFKEAQATAVQKENLKAFESRLNDADFKAKLMKVLRMTNQLADIIHVVEQYKTPLLSQVIPAIEPLWDTITSRAPTLLAGGDDEVGAAVKLLIGERFVQLARPIGWLAAALDPRNHDLLLSRRDRFREKIMNIIDRECENGSARGQLLVEWWKWLSQSGFHDWAFLKESLLGQDFSPALWWEAEGDHLPALQALAKRVLTIPATIPAEE
eukprot:scaffold2022_cov387-Prasinococcus_capsulatus_cf.AAC.3